LSAACGGFHQCKWLRRWVMRATIRLADKLFWEGGVGQDGVFGFKISAVGVVVQGFMNRGQGGRAVSPSLNSAGADNSSKEVAAATFF
jgi:hypothetical protein